MDSVAVPSGQYVRRRGFCCDLQLSQMQQKYFVVFVLLKQVGR